MLSLKKIKKPACRKPGNFHKRLFCNKMKIKKACEIFTGFFIFNPKVI
jgi:hypothetical protein